jgi:PAS domain S-box-containing protein
LILIGSESKEVLVQQAFSLNFHDYLLDPVHPDDLRLKISRAVDLWQLQLAGAQHNQLIDQVLQELSDCKAIETTLRESEERYRTLIERSPDAIYLIYNGKFEVINSKFTELFGVSLADAQAPNFVFTSIISPKGYNWPTAAKEQSPNGRHEGPHYEFVGQNKAGQEVELELYVSYLPYKNGLATQGILRDITERKQLERQLQQAQRMEAVGRLAGGIAHDFNNILTVISGLAALGLRRLAKDDSFHQDLVTIQNQTQRAAELVRQLLAPPGAARGAAARCPALSTARSVRAQRASPR